MQIVHQLDYSLFQFINQDLSNSFFDLMMPIIRNKMTWLPLYLFMFFYLIYTYKTKALIIVLFAILSIGFSDGISSHLLKPFFERIRPCQLHFLAENIIRRIDCSGGFSLPSSHAANHFALASFIGLVLLHKSKLFLYIGLLWAALISFAQVYVGVHFPIDVFVGMLLGLFIGILLFHYPFRFIRQKFSISF